MEPGEVALSEVHIGGSCIIADKTACSNFRLGRKDVHRNLAHHDEHRVFNSLTGPECDAGIAVKDDKYQYQIYHSEFIFERASSRDECENESVEQPEVDEDGDLILPRINRELCTIKIEHTLSTRLVDVGHQVWPGCLLLCDYILAHQDYFDKKAVLELGGGVGLASVVMATTAKTVICTDIGSSVLDLCAKNAQMNRDLYMYDDGETTQNVILVRELDWTKSNPKQVSSDKYLWSSNDEGLLDQISFIIAADVIYDEDLTTHFFRTFSKLMSETPGKVLFLAVERRLNFTLDDLEVSCPAYTHLLQCIEDLCQGRTENSGTKFFAEQIDVNFPQHLRYERSQYLVLWKISTAILEGVG